MWPIDEEKAAALRFLFEELLRQVPPFIESPTNAGYRCMEQEIPDMIGGFQENGRKVKISSRALTRLLAGEIDYQQFMESYGWAQGSEFPSPNPFAMARREGRVIKTVSVELAEGRDDGWLAIEFGDPDPAAAPFVANRRKASASRS